LWVFSTHTSRLRGQDIHWPRSRLVCVENTHNLAGGVVMGLAETEAVLEAAGRHGLKTHLDGARLFNAATYLGIPASRLARGFDSVNICLSKGLGAPVGSVVCGGPEFIEKARKYRKMLGGGWRQAGVLASAGLISLMVMTKRLAEDHRTARFLAEGLQAIPGIELELERVQTNILFITFTPPELNAREVSARLAERGILTSAGGPVRMRLVTHHQVSRQDAERVLEAFRDIFEGKPAFVSSGSALPRASAPY